MYSRRTPIRLPWFMALGIIIIAVAVFLGFQSMQTYRTEPLQPTLTRVAAVPSQQVQPTPTHTPVPKETVWRVTAEKANLVAEIIQLPFGKDDNWDLTYLNRFAGHLEGTPKVGQGGNHVLAGHVEMKDGTPGPFASINLLAPGDIVTLMDDTPNQPTVKRYMVTTIKIVSPNDLNEIRNHGFEELTLVTCQDYDAKGRLYRTRVVVHARAL